MTTPAGLPDGHRWPAIEYHCRGLEKNEGWEGELARALLALLDERKRPGAEPGQSVLASLWRLSDDLWLRVNEHSRRIAALEDARDV